ncbi:TonB family protein [Variovorax sp.]|uniref:TonB family protein n=1 Tax=Variovorax sp. TaxID=1871043 RepID=UPI00137D1F66|nr:TonB family protein [Variovorax sp.]KAF1073147.1 MAG: hypothetical protein GAK39_00028 [Variovorax sp.]
MTGHLAALSVLALAGCLVGPHARASTQAAPASSAQPRGDANPSFDFDIAAQPLEEALRRYATLTRRATLFRSELVAGRTSTLLQGRYAPEEALRRLLEGTGLSIEQVRTGASMAFVLKREDAPPALQRPRLETVPGGADYPALVQAGIWRALCADPRTAPGDYRSLLRVQVDAAGLVQRPRLLRSTGEPARDAALLAAVRRVRLDRAPPPDMPQPVTLLILPREPDASEPVQHCAGTAF